MRAHLLDIVAVVLVVSGVVVVSVAAGLVVAGGLVWWFNASLDS